MDLALDGHRVLVTGAAGGIGRAVCSALSAEGARVAVHYHTQGVAAEALAADLGGIAVGADLTVEQEVDDLYGRLEQDWGGLDAVVANAGIWPTESRPLWELPVARWRRTLDVDLTATFLTLRGFLRQAAARHLDDPPPTVVIVGSTAGTFGEAGHADYAAAKAALQVGLLRSLKNEIIRLHPRARANAVAPGWTVTPMTEGTLDEDLVRRATATVPLRKVATADDVAAAVLWLLSDRVAGHITGQVLTVAGGMEGRLLHPPGEAGLPFGP